MHGLNACYFKYRSYFKKRNKTCSDDQIKLNNFHVTQLSKRLQNDGHNCGVLCLKVIIMLYMHAQVAEVLAVHT